MNSISFIYLLIIVLCWTLNPFIKKIVLKSKKLNTDEYFILNHLFVTLILGFYFFYLFKQKKCSPNCFRNLDKFDYLYIILGAVTSVLGARLMISIIKSEDISYLVASIQPMIIGLSFAIGYMFFSENMTVSKIIGVTLIILGLIFMNKK
tara:strand:- start:74 stop:523 length:450 start_codon:yes stop_codon:yes gene_type:complete